jgi:hypothetical protein
VHFLKKEFKAITQGTWRSLNVTINRLSHAINNKLFEVAKYMVRKVNLQECGEHFQHLL